MVKERTSGFVQAYKKANEVYLYTNQLIICRSLKRESVWREILFETIPLEILEEDDYKQVNLLKRAIQYLLFLLYNVIGLNDPIPSTFLILN